MKFFPCLSFLDVSDYVKDIEWRNSQHGGKEEGLEGSDEKQIFDLKNNTLCSVLTTMERTTSESI